jgi:diphosphomevalonate decarboxylase
MTSNAYWKMSIEGGMKVDATALAHPNIAFIKYWGNRDEYLRLPSNGSISMNLDGLFTCTQVTYDPSLAGDELILEGTPVQGPALARVSAFLDLVRQMAEFQFYARVESSNNFPMGAGIASSASAFAALALAASAAAGLELSEKDLSRLARRGSGSACRSIPGGFVEWQVGEDDATSYAYSIAQPDHWSLADCIAILSQEHKPTGSAEGQARAITSLFQANRIADAPRRLGICRRAILDRDFAAFAEVVELDSNLMHAVMITSNPPLFYWQPATLQVIQAVIKWRQGGLPVCYTIDAGPNVHILSQEQHARQVKELLGQIPGVEKILVAGPGGAARLL